MDKMKTKKPPLSIKVIYWLTQIIFGLIVVVFFAAIGVNIVLQLGLLGDNMQLHTQMPVETCYTEKGKLEIFDRTMEVEFVEAIGQLHFVDTDQELAKWVGILLFGIICILLYIMLQFKRFIVNVYHGDIFERFNIQMLKNMAYGLIVLWGFMMIYSRFFYHYIASNIVFEHLVISENIKNYGFLLFIALILWVLSHIFMTGVKLKDEQSLTV
jgi:hypothetical protein